MNNSLDSLLIDRAEVYLRMQKSYEETGERFWQLLGSTLRTIAEEILTDEIENSFNRDHWKEDYRGYAYHPNWHLEIEGESEEFNLYPGLWFPLLPDDADIFRLFGIRDRPYVDVAVWATPLSAYANDLSNVRGMWEESVGAQLKPRGWQSYGDRVTTPGGEWGLRYPITLDHHQVAECLRAGDLRPAIATLEERFRDFASVCPAIMQLVERIRSSSKKAATP